MHYSEGYQVYICPMHSEIREDQPGRCPECGMNLIKIQNAKIKNQNDNAKLKNDKHKGHSTSTFLKKFWASFVLTIPIVLYSELPMRLGWELPRFAGWEWFILLLGSVVFFYGGWGFLAGAVREIRGRSPGMMTLIGIAIVAAYSFSVFETLRGLSADEAGSAHTLFWELSTLITIMILGHYLEMRAVQGVQGALKELAKLLPDQAEIIRNGQTEIVALAELKQGDLVLVKPGSRVPADGEITEGDTEIDESLVTGESRPVQKNRGDKVIAGTINGDGSVKILVTEIGEKTFLAGVMRLVSEAQASKSRLQILSDRAAFYLTIIALSAGALTFISWLAAGRGAVTATERLVAVLVVACPHALGLAVPLVASISTAMAARKGFLVKQRLALEAAKDVDVVLFDKTGTLTRGEFGVVQILPEGGDSETHVLQLAASVNQHSEHPLAKAMVQKAREQNLNLAAAVNFQRLPGGGTTAHVKDQEVTVGSPGLLAQKKLKTGNPEKIAELGKQGKTVIYVIASGRLVGSIALGDIVRQESREAVRILKKLGIKTAMITGDSDEVAGWVAGELGIDEYFAQIRPEQKAEKVKLLQQRGQKVAMVGDGINDAPALSQADLGIAVGAGTNVAIESAGIILFKNDPRDIAKIIKLSQITYRKMVQNLFWATGYNVLALPLAAGVLAGKGIVLQPALAAVLMSLSTVIVAVNAVLLRNKQF